MEIFQVLGDRIVTYRNYKVDKKYTYLSVIKNGKTRYIMHPTIDCIIQATYATLLQDTDKELRVLPQTMYCLVISNS